MNTNRLKSVGIATVIVLTATPEQMTWAANPVFSGFSLLASNVLTASIVSGSGDYTLQQTLDTQTQFARRTATEDELQYATRNGKATFERFTAAKKAELLKSKTRYTAVATASSGEITASNGGTDLMIYDIQSGTTVNKFIYTVKIKSKGDGAVGSMVKLDNYRALIASK